MPTEYNPNTAKHYAAYRPSLHLPILQKCIKNEHYALGLDVGCGTGQSAFALSHFCDKVIAIDPSESMLKNAITHDLIEYRYCNGQDLNFKPKTFDIITFAGALFYAKSQHLLQEVEKVAKPKAKVIIYDFMVLLDQTLEQLGVTPPTKQQLNYDPKIDFDGLNILKLHLQNKVKAQIAIEISSANLGHLLLGDSDHFALLAGKFGETNLYAKLLTQLENLVSGVTHQIDAHIFYTQYST